MHQHSPFFVVNVMPLMMSRKKEISVLGCGWYGLELAKELIANDYQVKGSTTSSEKLAVLEEAGILPYLINLHDKEQIFANDFFTCTILLINIPPKRSSSEQHTFLPKIKSIMEACVLNDVEQVIFISSTSVYGEHNKEVDELTLAIPDTDSGKAILAAEQLLKSNSNFTTTIIRFGGLIGPDRNPGKFFAGKSAIPNGKAPVNLIHRSDCIGITMSILAKAAYGQIYNACSSDHPDRALFYTEASARAGLEAPEFIDELLQWKIVNSVTIPEQLDYSFQVPIHLVTSQ